MKITLLTHTPNPELVVATAARQCYAEGGAVGFYDEMYSDLTDSMRYIGMREVPQEKNHKLLRKVLSMGHTSVLEHATFTFAVEGISRACSHQLVRFRVASFSQQSQRYVEASESFAHVIPPSIQGRQDLLEEYEDFMTLCGGFYKSLVQAGIPAEDARFVLPNASETKLLFTMNAREIYHACALRECDHAQWEIRDLFHEVNRLVRPVAPVLFEKLGPSCVATGTCPEGVRCCGRVNKET